MEVSLNWCKKEKKARQKHQKGNPISHEIVYHKSGEMREDSVNLLFLLDRSCFFM